MANTTVEIVRSLEGLGPLRSDWNRLHQKLSVPDVFMDFRWANAYYSSVTCELVVIVLRTDKTVTAIIPLCYRDAELRVVGDDLSDYFDVLTDSEFGEDQWNAAFEALQQLDLPWKRCVLRNLRETSKLVSAAQTGRTRWPAIVETGNLCLAVCSSVDSGAFRSLVSKSNPKRCQTKLERIGRLEFNHVESNQDVARELPNFFRHHMIRRSVANATKGIFADIENQKFFERLVHDFDAHNELRFAKLTLNEETVAYHFGFEIDNRYLWYVPAFNVDFSRYHPGFVLLRFLFNYCDSNLLTEFDFTVGDEPYKSRFSNAQRRNLNLTVYPSSAKSLLTKARDVMKKSHRVSQPIRFIRNLRRRTRSTAATQERLTAFARRPIDDGYSVADLGLTNAIQLNWEGCNSYQSPDAYEYWQAGQRFLALKRSSDILCTGWFRHLSEDEAPSAHTTLHSIWIAPKCELDELEMFLSGVLDLSYSRPVQLFLPSKLARSIFNRTLTLTNSEICKC
jgi:CelD/BcsL family acetyltransferase involved in cellulose biosynthesis